MKRYTDDDAYNLNILEIGALINPVFLPKVQKNNNVFISKEFKIDREKIKYRDIKTNPSPNPFPNMGDLEIDIAKIKARDTKK